MKVLVVYDSLYGNTEKIAQAIGKVLESNNEVKVQRVGETNVSELISINLLIVGSPTYGGRPSQPVKTFLDKIMHESLKGVKAASFDTGTPTENQGFFINNITKFFGRASPRIAKVLKEIGADIIGFQTFIVLGKEGPLREGELERAAGWAKEIVKSNNLV